MTINSAHANRHSLAANISERDAPVAKFYNPNTGREGRIVEQNGNVFVVVVDALGLLVTKFCRSKPAHGGVNGTKQYLIRNGYKEE